MKKGAQLDFAMDAILHRHATALKIIVCKLWDRFLIKFV